MDSTSEIAVSLPFGNFFKINSFAQNAGLEQQNKKKKIHLLLTAGLFNNNVNFISVFHIELNKV